MSDKIDGFTNANYRLLTADILAALKPLEAKYGIAFDLGGGRLDADSRGVSVKLRAACSTEGDPMHVTLFKERGEFLGFKLADLDREFQLGRHRYKLTGLMNTKGRNNVLATALRNGRQYTMSHVDVLTALKSPAPAAVTRDETKDKAVRDRVKAVIAKFANLPPYGNDFRVRMNAESALFEELSTISREVGEGLAVGKMISYGVADGKAHYVIMRVGRQVEVEHVPFGDAYTSPVVRNGRMSLGHAQDAVRHADGMSRLFGKAAA